MVSEFPKDLSSKKLKVCLTEIYASVKEKISTAVKEAKGIYLNLPFIYLSVDLWKSLKSGEKYIGIKIYFRSGDGHYHTGPVHSWQLQNYFYRPFYWILSFC